MLVGYSSSSEDEEADGGEAAAADSAPGSGCSRKCEEEDGANDGSPVRKKSKAEEQVPKTRCVCHLGVCGGFLPALRRCRCNFR